MVFHRSREQLLVLSQKIQTNPLVKNKPTKGLMVRCTYRESITTKTVTLTVMMHRKETQHRLGMAL